MRILFSENIENLNDVTDFPTINPISFFQMTTYPTPFAGALTGHSATMAYLKAGAPTYHMGGLSLGMPGHSLDSLQSHYSHGGRKRFNFNN